MNKRKTLPYDETVQCVQCGYCLPACPTYLTMKRETHSPRGRINLVQMAAEGHLSLDELEEPLDLCLGCRACETACPSGVQYGKILEDARGVLAEYKGNRTSTPLRWIEDKMFQNIFPSPKKLQLLTDVIWLYQASGVQAMVHKGKLNHVLSDNLRAFEAVLPKVSSPLKRRKRPRLFKPPIANTLQWKVAFFTGCIMDAIFEKINRLSMELLALAGCEVHVIGEQTCCGALHAHAGRLDDAKILAKRNIEAFERLDVDFIVNNAGGCGGMLVEYDHLFHDDPQWEERAKAFVAKTRDISQVLAQCELPLTKPVNEIITYQRSCHMTNVQKVTTEPLDLIKRIPGVTFREMANPDMCCGSAGIYNVLNYKESMEILDVKMETVKETTATTIVTTNPGCLLQMKLGVQREGLSERVRVVHLAELLAESAELL
ncbi:glycolate oxidase iron-sulfur subunit [Caldalkalibacillus uzonensis]|uniref:Glycolate oxidase iron-sulfur subunit n=1 Tax=Caldalkalibacillus uzonensis TaxID=353224 RepID=A0ABU0CR04_9BACI|nr:(Fe-S)-binding protein [Caldalkalibacillus uzonensis]MDQ0338314.1 glycolate oxidase iron-sulfur subunit [Caldalkalibacillus uzonensis]